MQEEQKQPEATEMFTKEQVIEIVNQEVSKVLNKRDEMLLKLEAVKLVASTIKPSVNVSLDQEVLLTKAEEVFKYISK